MDKNIYRTLIPAVVTAIGLVNTGCVATRCYEGYATAGYETTYVTTPSLGTTYVTQPVIETFYDPVCIRTHSRRYTVPPRHVPHRPHAEPVRRPANGHVTRPQPHHQAKPGGTHAKPQSGSRPNTAPKTNHRQRK